METNTQLKKSTRGGKRPNQTGRPKGSKVIPSIDVCIEELVFPAICAAWKAAPTDGTFSAHWTIHLSKTQIRLAYGKEGIDTFMSFFKEERRGGVDRYGVPYQTRWIIPIGVYKTVKTLVEKLGHNLDDLPSPGFPPPALIRRVAEAEHRRELLKQRKLEKILKDYKQHDD